MRVLPHQDEKIWITFTRFLKKPESDFSICCFLLFFLVLDWWANEKWFKYRIIKQAMEQWAIIITVNNYCKCTSKLGEVCIHCLKRTSKKGTLFLNTQKHITSFLHDQQRVKHAFYLCFFSSNFNRTAHMEKAEKPSSGWTKRPLTCPQLCVLLILLFNFLDSIFLS